MSNIAERISPNFSDHLSPLIVFASSPIRPQHAIEPNRRSEPVLQPFDYLKLPFLFSSPLRIRATQSSRMKIANHANGSGLSRSLFAVTFSWLGGSRNSAMQFTNCKWAYIMGYSLHIPLPRGTLKVKSESKLRPRERSGNVPTLRLFSTYFVWQPNASQPEQTKQSKNGE